MEPPLCGAIGHTLCFFSPSPDRRSPPPSPRARAVRALTPSFSVAVKRPPVCARHAGEQDLEITVAQLAPEQPPRDSTWTFRYTNFGEVLLSADVDGDGFADLVVGAPLADPTVTAEQV